MEFLVDLVVVLIPIVCFLCLLGIVELLDTFIEKRFPKFHKLINSLLFGEDFEDEMYDLDDSDEDEYWEV